MEFGVLHEISDPQAWQKSSDAASSWPEEFSVLSFVEAEDKSRALCGWRAQSRAILQKYLDRNLGRGTVTTIFPVALRLFQTPSI